MHTFDFVGSEDDIGDGDKSTLGYLACSHRTRILDTTRQVWLSFVRYFGLAKAQGLFSLVGGENGTSIFQHAQVSSNHHAMIKNMVTVDPRCGHLRTSYNLGESLKPNPQIAQPVSAQSFAGRILTLFFFLSRIYFPYRMNPPIIPSSQDAAPEICICPCKPSSLCQKEFVKRNLRSGVIEGNTGYQCVPDVVEGYLHDVVFTRSFLSSSISISRIEIPFQASPSC